MRHKRRQNRKKYRRVVILIASLVLILVYIFLFSPLFKIRAIEVSGNKEVETEEIKNNFSYKNIFLFTEKKIKDDLISKFPKISDLEVRKNLIKRVVNLIIKERERMGIVCQVDRIEEGEKIKDCFYVDKQGFIFEDAPQTSGSLILLIKDYSNRDFRLGQKVFEERIMNFISKIKENLFLETGVRVLDFNILSFPTKELKVITSQGWYILFDLERGAENQILALKAALEEKIPDREGLEYVDLRIENRIYYK